MFGGRTPFARRWTIDLGRLRSYGRLEISVVYCVCTYHLYAQSVVLGFFGCGLGRGNLFLGGSGGIALAGRHFVDAADYEVLLQRRGWVVEEQV